MAKMVWDRTKPKMTEGTPVRGTRQSTAAYVTERVKQQPRTITCEVVKVEPIDTHSEPVDAQSLPEVVSGNSLREIIGAEMASQGYSSYELARESGVSKSVVGRFLKGERDVTSKTLDKMFGSLGLVVARRND
jgi:ribosome-binding protein aMBF1 (putative translation factor)